MPFYIPYSEDYLAHHGILGMKLGVRRYQNKDGSYTELGRKHYGHEKRQSQKQYGGLFTKKTPEEKTAAQERKARSKINALKRQIEENEDEILRNSSSADEYAKKAEEHRAIAAGYQKKSDEYTRANNTLEWFNSNHSRKIQKLEKEIEKLQQKKMSEVKADPDILDDTIRKAKDSGVDFGDDPAPVRPKRSYDPERSETTLRDYAKSGKVEKEMKSEFDKMRNNSKSDEEKDRKVASWEKARDKDLWDLNFLEAVQNSKALHEGDTTTLLREYAKYLDHPTEYFENDEYSRLKPA